MGEPKLTSLKDVDYDGKFIFYISYTWDNFGWTNAFHTQI